MSESLSERPIPPQKEEENEKIYSREIRDCGERLVPMSLFPEKVLVLPEYFIQGIPSALPEAFVRESVVDLTIVDARGCLLPMGSGFDEDSDRSMTRYYEEKLERGESLDPKEEKALRNRRLLFNLLTEEDFCNYPDEWWHFAYGTQAWSWEKGTPHAIYGFTEPDFRWG